MSDDERGLGMILGELSARVKNLEAGRAADSEKLDILVAERNKRQGAFHMWQAITGTGGVGLGYYLAKFGVTLAGMPLPK